MYYYYYRYHYYYHIIIIEASVKDRILNLTLNLAGAGDGKVAGVRKKYTLLWYLKEIPFLSNVLHELLEVTWDLDDLVIFIKDTILAHLVQRLPV